MVFVIAERHCIGSAAAPVARSVRPGEPERGARLMKVTITAVEITIAASAMLFDDRLYVLFSSLPMLEQTW